MRSVREGEVVADRGLPHVAERLNFLFEYIPNPQGSKYSNAQAAKALSDNDVPATATYVSQLRSGERKNPSASIIGGLADLFGVQVAYFFDEQVASQTQDELATMTAMRDSRVRSVMARAAGVSERGFSEALRKTLNHTQRDPEDTGGSTPRNNQGTTRQE